MGDKSKLAALREAIGAIPAFRTPRGSMTPKRRRDILTKYDGLCAGCDEPLAGRKWIAEHILPLELGGADTLENLQPLCNDGARCVVGKNRDDARRIAKMRRQAKMDLRREEPSRFQSRPFPKSTRPLQSRGFDKRKVSA